MVDPEPEETDLLPELGNEHVDCDGMCCLPWTY